MPNTRGDAASADSHQLTNTLVQGFALELKEIIEEGETAGPDTITEQRLRFAILGGLAVYCCCFVVGFDNELLQECTRIRKPLHNNARI